MSSGRERPDRQESSRQREQVWHLAKTDPSQALNIARLIPHPWFKTQALSAVARYSPHDTIQIAEEAVRAADEGEDAYQRTAVRAWVIAALAEREFLTAARRLLRETVSQAGLVVPLNSRAVALTLLCHAALLIGKQACGDVRACLLEHCANDVRWQCKRAIKNTAMLMEQSHRPRPFFW